MFTSSKSPPLKSTSFSDFVRNARSGDKKKMFGAVLEQASKDQKDLVARANNEARNR